MLLLDRMWPRPTLNSPNQRLMLSAQIPARRTSAAKAYYPAKTGRLTL